MTVSPPKRAGEETEKKGRYGECRRCEPSYGRLLQIRAVLNSYCGHFGHFRAYRMLQTQFTRSPLRRYFDFTAHYRKAVLKKEFVPEVMPFENGIC
mgnify:CR=1 FL=1